MPGSGARLKAQLELAVRPGPEATRPQVDMLWQPMLVRDLDANVLLPFSPAAGEVSTSQVRGSPVQGTSWRCRQLLAHLLHLATHTRPHTPPSPPTHQSTVTLPHHIKPSFSTNPSTIIASTRVILHIFHLSTRPLTHPLTHAPTSPC